jgi:2-phosphosulfolactate phosphatase
MSEEEIFSQAPYAARLEWGLDGARLAAARGDIVVVVDVLRFSSAAVMALVNGAVIFPHAGGAAADALARQVGAGVLDGRGDGQGAPSLSPASFGAAHRGRRYVLCSPNGAACAQIAGDGAAAVFVGCLLNARGGRGGVARAGAARRADHRGRLRRAPCGAARRRLAAMP